MISPLQQLHHSVEIGKGIFLSKNRTDGVKKNSKIILSGMRWLRQGWTLGIALVFGVGGAIGSGSDRTLAQIQGDSTQGTLVNGVPTGLCAAGTCTITGGTQTGTNLFHSFSQFSVPTGGTAFFNNDLTIENIISRVIGPASTIDGLLRANGTANLFLINPNGITFGQNAQLNLGGSFVASTANNITLPDGTKFSATTSQTPPLLTVSVPLGVQFGLEIGANSGNITVGSDGSQAPKLAVSEGNTLALVGGNVTLNRANLDAPEGRILINGRDQVLIDKNSVLTSTSSSDSDTSNFGIIQIEATQGSVFLRQSYLSTTNSSNGYAGDISINARDQIVIENSTGINPQAGILSEGDSGRILIGTANEYSTVSPKTVTISNSTLKTNGLGSGLAGNISIRASDQISISNNSEISSSSNNDNTSDFGLIKLDATNGSVFLNNSTLSTTNIGEGFAGDISINGTGQVVIENKSTISSQGNSGAITIGSSAGGDSFLPTQVTIDNSTLKTNSVGAGSAGNIGISARQQISIANDTEITSASINNSSSSFGSIQLAATQGSVFLNQSRLNTSNAGEGLAGDISITARDQVVIEKLIGTNPTGQLRGIFSEGENGRILIGESDYTTISPNTVKIDNSMLSTTNFGSGLAGDISISATDSVNIQNKSLIFSEGDYGRILIGESEYTSVSPKTVNIDNSVLSTNNRIFEMGNVRTEASQAGDISIVSSDSIFLDNGAKISADTSQEKGNIYLNSPLVLLRRGSNISTNATGLNSSGGNISIDTTFLVAVPKENSDITANSKDASGGNVEVTATDGGIYGIQFREQLTPRSDITATGRESGTVILYTSGIDPEKGLAELPVTLDDPSKQIVSGCAAARGNSFIVTGRGGLPEDPTGTIRGQTVWRDLRDFSQETGVVQQTPPQKPQALMGSRTPRLVEANSWVFDEKGNVVLVAVEGNGTPSTYRSRAPECQDKSSVSAPKN